MTFSNTTSAKTASTNMSVSEITQYCANKTLLVVAAGTGGHIFPGLTVAQEWRAQGGTVAWLGTKSGMENRLVPAQGITLHRVAFNGLRGKGLLHKIRGAGQLMISMIGALLILRQIKPDAVLCMGGYITVPVGFACALRRWLTKCPLILFNADLERLLSNRVLQKYADRILFGLGDHSTTHHVLGNAIRANLRAITAPEQRYTARTENNLRILVVGGSLGAQVFNHTLPTAFALWQETHPDCVLEIIHQCGSANNAAIELIAQYSALNITAKVVTFIDDMARAYSEADVVFCRSGAMTVSELCAVGVAAVCIPFVAATTAHQVGNARWLAAHGAAVHLPQNELNSARLSDLLSQLTRERCCQYAIAARRLAQVDAHQKIISTILSCVSGQILTVQLGEHE